MRRIAALVVVFLFFAAPASAALYDLQVSHALQFTSGVVAPTDTGSLDLVTQSEAAYGEPMQGAVGYFGQINEDHTDGDTTAVITISAGGNPFAGATAYTGYRAFVANDNDDPWQYKLYLKTTGGTYESASWTAVAKQASTVLTLNQAFNTSNVLDIGIKIQGTFGSGSPSDPDFFHTSVVPVHGAAILGLLGLGAAGLKLRRYV
jgi:hypothetical protein